ncbi:MAG: ABC transporter permease [Burkholderiaceae bacterium]
MNTSPKSMARSLMLRSMRLPFVNADATMYAGLAGLALIILCALFGPSLYPHDPWEMEAMPLLLPGAEAAHPLGTDAMGRDVLAGLIHGARTSLIIGLFGAAFAMLIGIVVGSIAGYFRGRIDDLLMRITEIYQTIPIFIFLIVLVAIFGPKLWTITWAIAVVSWPPVARITRAEFLSLREREFVSASILMGVSDLRIICSEVLPNALPPVIVLGSIVTANAILNEAALAFLGLGDPNVISWGSMIGSGREYLRTAWHLSAIPGVAILITVLSISLVGEWMNQVLNPKGRR